MERATLVGDDKSPQMPLMVDKCAHIVRKSPCFVNVDHVSVMSYLLVVGVF